MGQQKHQLVQMYNHQFTAAKEFYQELSSRRQCVLSSGWWWPCANYCPLQITLLSPASDDISALPRPGTSGRPTLAASWRQLVRSGGGGGLCRLYLDTGDWEQFPVFLQIPPATLNLVFSSLGPGRAQLGEERGRRGETVVQGFRTLGDWWGSVLLLLQILDGSEQLSQVCAVSVLASAVSFCSRHFLFE